PNDPSAGSNETNASPTEHQGIEFGLDTILWREAGDAPEDQRSSLTLRQTYTWSDFRYKNDPAYGKNRLPSVPEHYYQAELLYQHSGGFYAGLNAKSASSAWVDYANTFEADGWVVFGANAGYQPRGKNWKV